MEHNSCQCLPVSASEDSLSITFVLLCVLNNATWHCLSPVRAWPSATQANEPWAWRQKVQYVQRLSSWCLDDHFEADNADPYSVPLFLSATCTRHCSQETKLLWFDRRNTMRTSVLATELDVEILGMDCLLVCLCPCGRAGGDSGWPLH